VRVPELLRELSTGNVRLWADGERLRCSAPTGALTPELHARLREYKGEILEFLHSAETLCQTPRAIVPFQLSGSRIPVFAVAGHNGDVFCYRALAERLGTNQPFFGLQPPGLDGQSEPLARIEDLAKYFATQIRAFRPAGPFIIAGFCAGGTIAFELARQLLQQNQEISFLALFGCPFPTAYRPLPRLRQELCGKLKRVLEHARRLMTVSFLNPAAQIQGPLGEPKPERPPRKPDPVLVLRAKVQRATIAAAGCYTPGHFAGRVIQFLPCREWVRSGYEPLRWRLVAQHAEEYFGLDGCSSALMLREPHAPVFARLFSQCSKRWGNPS
jgi:thioesterase domain-containing protein